MARWQPSFTAPSGNICSGFSGARHDAEAELGGIMEAYLAHYYRIVGHRNYLFPGAASLLRAPKAGNP